MQAHGRSRILFSALALAAHTAPALGAGVTTDLFGTLADGAKVERFTLANDAGMTVQLISRGATITSIRVPGRDGEAAEVTVAPGDLPGVVASNQRYGAIIGRYAGRLAAGFDLNGTHYKLAAGRSGVTLHGGEPGFDSALWHAKPFSSRAEIGVAFDRISPAGEQGFPGQLAIQVRYALSRRNNRLTISYHATADAPTFVNLTNHAYYDLSGHHSLRCQMLQADAARYVETDARVLPTGRLAPVDGGPLDLRKPVALLARATATDPLTVARRGLNDMIAMDPGGAARLWDVESGRTMVLRTTEPGIQVYTANFLDGTDRDAQGRPLTKYNSVALEAQRFPDSPNHPDFPSTLVEPGKPYRARTTIAFDVDRFEGRALGSEWSRPKDCAAAN